MITSIHRKIDIPSLEFLHKSAWSGGLDLLHQWQDKKYYVSLNTVFSKVNGTKESITSTQLASERYFQRPDNNHRDVDTTLTSLSGIGGQFKIGKQAGKFNYEFGTSFLSPDLELNNQGFLMSTDNITQWMVASYQINKPFNVFRSMRAHLIQFSMWDFGKKNTLYGFDTNLGAQFSNFWSFNMGLNFDLNRTSNADLRGGPSIKYPGTVNLSYFLETDSRKKFRIMFNNWYNWGLENYSQNIGFWMRFQYRPIDVLDVSLSPNISYNRNNQQYVTTSSFQGDARYITSEINQKTYRIEFRLNYNINPNLSFTYWGQPFITQGEYSEFKRITNSTANNYFDRFHTFDQGEISYDEDNGKYLIDENNNGTTDYEFYNPNFNFLQFRSNAVLRWEYKPGSAFFLVWTQNRTDNPPFAAVNNDLGSLTDGLFSVTPENIFLLKFTYRFIL